MAVNTDPRCPRCGAYLANIGPHHMTDCGRMTDVAMHVAPLSGEGSVGERTANDFAIEFGEYLAKAAEHYIAAVTAFVDEDPDATNDAYDGLRSAIYEFRKRSTAAAAPLPAQEVTDAMLRNILAAEYRKAGSTIPFEQHEKHEGPWLAICYSAMRAALESTLRTGEDR